MSVVVLTEYHGVSVVVLTEGRQFIEDEETKCCGSLAEEEPRTGERRDHTGQTPLRHSVLLNTRHTQWEGGFKRLRYTSVHLFVCLSVAVAHMSGLCESYQINHRDNLGQCIGTAKVE